MFKKIMSPFVEFETKAPEAKPSTPVVQGVAPVAPVVQSERVEVQTQFPEVDPKTRQFFVGLMESKNLPGYDYFEYTQALEILKSAIPDVTARHKAALAMAKSMGATPEHILQSADTYLGILEEERVRFLKDCEGKRKSLGDKESEILVLEDRVKVLQAQIKEIEAKKSSLSGEIVADLQKINKVSRDFEEVSKEFNQRILSDKKDIQAAL